MKKILIVRLSAIGDIVMASPIIGALRARFPDAKISWLVQPESKTLLEHNQDLEEVIIWPRNRWRGLWRDKQWIALWRELRQFRRMLRERRFDLAIDMQGLLKSGLLAWLSGAGERMGLGSKEGSHLLMSRVVERGGDPERIGSEYLHLAEQLGLDPGSFEMEIALAAADERFAHALVDTGRLQAGYAVICPFTTRPQKHWFDESWIELISRLREESGLPVVILGGPGDRTASASIVAAVGDDVIDLTGETGLTQAAALIKHSALLVGVDTGLTHMGIAFHRPTLALFGSTCPYRNTTRDNAWVLYHRFPCSPCRRNPICNGDFSCMAAITVDEVQASATRLLARSGTGQ